MKKLMFTAAALMAGIAVADIQSSNIVGYANGSINASGNNFVTAPFFGVGYNTTDIQDIKLVGSGGWGSETFQIWEGLPSVVDGTFFMWVGTEWNEDYSVAIKGEWQKDDTSTAVFSIPGGQAVTINSEPGIGIENAGQVPVEKVEFTLAEGNNFTGNPFPATLDIQNIKIVGSGGWGTETFQIWEGLPSVVDGTFFMWVGTEWNEDYSVAIKGEWQKDDTSTAVFSLDPYQGCVINGSAGLKVEITPSYDLSK